MSELIPPHTTPVELAERLGAGPRWVADKVRELRCYRKVGGKVIMLEDDVKTFLEATRPCHLNSTYGAKSGTTGAPSTASDYEEVQARLSKKTPNASRRKPKPKRGEVISMDQGRI